LGASLIIARRKSLHSEEGIEANAPLFMMSLPLSTASETKQCFWVGLFEFIWDGSKQGVTLIPHQLS
jgi:hypothetical protein